MKKLIHKIVFAFTLLFASHAFAQNMSFVADENATPVELADSNGIKAFCQIGSLYGKKAFTLTFQNTNKTAVSVFIHWRFLVQAADAPLQIAGRTRPFKLAPGESVDLSTIDPTVKQAIVVKRGTTMDNYKFAMRVHNVETGAKKEVSN